MATPFVRKLTPIVRYRVGDRAVWLPSACSCGRSTPLFRLLGRSDDVLRIGFDSIDYAFVQKVAARVSGATGTIQMEKSRSHGKDKLTIRIEVETADSDEIEKISRQFSIMFTSERPSFREFVDKGTVWPVEVECVKLGALPRNPRTGKLKGVIDSFDV